MDYKLFLVWITLFAMVISQPLPSRNYYFTETLPLTTNNYYQLYWKFTDTEMYIGIVCNTSIGGYCAIGWSKFGLMPGSDAVIGSVNGGVPHIEDYILNSKTPPGNGTCPNAACPESLPLFPAQEGCYNNVNNTIGSIQGTFTILEFSRPIAASDNCDMNISNSEYIIYSMGDGNVPLGIYQHFTRFASVSPFAWFRPIPTTGIPTTGTTTTGAISSTGVLTTGQPPTTSQTTGIIPETTGIQTTGIPTPVTTGIVSPSSAGIGVQSSSKKGPLGLAPWLGILIIVIIICVLLTIIAVVVGLIVRKKKHEKENQGNFY